MASVPGVRPLPPVGRHDDRAQSEVVGVILLTATVIIIVSLFGVFFLGGVTDRAQERPFVDFEVTATDEHVRLSHTGGDRVPIDALSVVLHGGGDVERHALSDGTVVSASDGDPDRFEATERVVLDHGFGAGPLVVRVVHEPSNAVVHTEHLDVAVGSGTATSAAFDYSPAEPSVGGPVTFDASAASGTEGVLRYEWDWDGDGDADDTATGPVVDHSFDAPGGRDVTLTVVAADGSTDETTRTVPVASTAPTIESTSLTDGDDDLVSDGDEVTVTATVTGAVDGVTADASAFDAGDVPLSEDTGDETYEATFEVGGSATDGEQMVTVEATDRAGQRTTAVTDDPVTVDVTPPEIATFAVADESEGNFYFLYWEYVEMFDVEWAVTDERLENVTVTVDREGATRESYRGDSGSETYENVRGYRSSGREHDLTIVGTDAAGNRACRTVTDLADGADPPGSTFESC